jgi:UDP-galactopyranose mutase
MTQPNGGRTYDFLIVGAGLFGAVFAREMTDKGKSCLVIDRRPHIAGNCFTRNVNGISVHEYGPHIFHTQDEGIWRYVNRFARFHPYIHRSKVFNAGRLFSFPVNLATLHQLWGVLTPEEAEQKLAAVREDIPDPKNLEDWALSQVGREIYETFIEGYTRKQWNKDPKELPASILKRIPIRLSFNDNYFDDRFQGIPVGGYTGMVSNMLEGVEVRLDADYFQQRPYWNSLASRVVFTGCIDEFFDYADGELEYRSLRFETSVLEKRDAQGTAIVNYSERHVPFTRIVEHKHFEFGTQPTTVVTKEFPKTWSRGDTPYYPINDARNEAVLRKYQQRAKSSPHVIFGGRLGEYRYYDMHQVVGSALSKVRQVLAEAKP